LQAAALETPNGEAVTNLHRAVQTSRSLIQVEPIGTGTRPSNLGVALSPDGTTLFASVDSGSIQVWDVDSRRLLRTLGTPRADQRADELNVALSPDGRRLAVIDEAGMIHVWDALDWSEQQIQAAGSATDRPVFSPDGSVWLP
jgi:WD40 repeat protein